MGTTNTLDLNNRVTKQEKAIAGLTASDVAYDNTDSGLSATNVQGAVDEIEDGLHWQFVDTITSSHSVTVPTSHELLFVALNDTLGTAFGSLTIPTLSLPGAISIPYHNNDNVILSRSGDTYSTAATGKVVRVYRR